VIATAVVPIEVGGQVQGQRTREVFASDIVEFLDKRWTRAEADAACARRSILLLFGLVVGLSVLTVGLAVAAAGLIAVVMFVQGTLDRGASSVASAMLAVAGAGALLMAARRASIFRRS
jgi:hypothetical protein